ncbi:MAG: nuclear transport factor 2 family protein [Sphingorhabdus sp.]
MIHDPAAIWHSVALSRDTELISRILHENCIFESPVVHAPQVGKAITAKYLAAAGHVLGNSEFEYVGQWHRENSAILEFRTTIDGIAINGIDMISCDDDGLITHFKVMVRPLKAVNKLHEKMGEMLQKMSR